MVSSPFLRPIAVTIIVYIFMSDRIMLFYLFCIPLTLIYLKGNPYPSTHTFYYQGGWKGEQRDKSTFLSRFSSFYQVLGSIIFARNFSEFVHILE